jgi:hypothetical protein
MLQLNCSSRGLAHRPSLKQQTHRLLPCRLAAQSGVWFAIARRRQQQQQQTPPTTSLARCMMRLAR